MHRKLLIHHKKRAKNPPTRGRGFFQIRVAQRRPQMPLANCTNKCAHSPHAGPVAVSWAYTDDMQHSSAEIVEPLRVFEGRVAAKHENDDVK
jgi:hypothetical protein